MLRFIKRYAALFFVTAAFHSFSVAIASENIPITLKEAWSMVNANNDALKAARAGVKQAEFTKLGTKSLNLPDISLGANYLYLDDDVELSPDELFQSMEGGIIAAQFAAGLAQSYGLTPTQLNGGLTSTISERELLSSSIRGSWPLYTGGRISAAQDIAVSQVQEARYNLQQKNLLQFQKLVHNYFGAVLAQQVLNTRRDVELGLGQHRDHAILLEQQGQIARVEMMQSEASFDKAVVDRKKAERDLEIARLALTRMLKSSQSVRPSEELFIASSLPSVDEFIGDTLRSYPGLGILDAKIEQAAGLASIEKGKYLPSVAVVGNYSLYEEESLATSLTPDWFLGVGVSISLLERSGRSGKFQAARSAMQRLEHLSHQAQSDLTLFVEKNYRHTMQALEEFYGLGSSQKLAEENVSLRIKAFNQGLGTSLDVVDAELFLADVKTQRAVAAFNYVDALGQLMGVSSSPETFFTYQNNQGIEE
ncbi:TolC family protein [Desulfopila sp. IMCC35008]|uniref:TolC family protein n=1 Tax=Desulfopila sp. IMCC35008 TaxID=2653858 RepID=UPI0013D6B081|nr:TolC family protein [Desulfopila sp. IMCC35008]